MKKNKTRSNINKKVFFLLLPVLLFAILAINTKTLGCNSLLNKYKSKIFPLNYMIQDSCERCGAQVTKIFADKNEYANVCLRSDVDLDGNPDLVVGTTLASNHPMLSQDGYILINNKIVFEFPVEGVLAIGENKTGVVIQRGLKDYPLCCETGYIETSYTYTDGVLKEVGRKEIPPTK